MKKLLTSLLASGIAAIALTSCFCDYNSCCDSYPSDNYRPCPVPKGNVDSPRPHIWDNSCGNSSNYEY
ncbi:hypothetical protein [Parachlamydia sp. AcF125]|uniref:hypothetical protein n=1 Tax=Parachlamydia sp. AcF125 TaxID=2795736 RepID=UPI001BC9FC3C|nr:hypothetical protein [Parachlamydia sp. AcF125]MBS4169203.1 hypothetical protein [Parachlamydia sp. AcF125]